MAKKNAKGSNYGSPDMLNQLLAAAETSGNINDLLNEVQKGEDITKQVIPEPDIKTDERATSIPVEGDDQSLGNQKEFTEGLIPETSASSNQTQLQEGTNVAVEEVKPPGPVQAERVLEDKPATTGGKKDRKKNKIEVAEEGSFESAVFKRNEKPDSLKYAYLYPETHAYLDILTRYAKLKKIKTSMQDITANIVKVFIRNNIEEFRAMVKALNDVNKGLDM